MIWVMVVVVSGGGADDDGGSGDGDDSVVRSGRLQITLKWYTLRDTI